MDETRSESSNERANQSWRKKPRKFAPKSRLGCKTCKIRRVKCDLSRPSCLKCHSTGRTCDGYKEVPSISEAMIESSHYQQEKLSKVDSYASHHPCTTISAYQSGHAQTKRNDHILPNPGPFMILQVNGTAEAEAMCFFEYFSIRHLNEYHPSGSWRETLMFFSQTVQSVRYAAIALALIQRNKLDHASTASVGEKSSFKSWPSDKTPLIHYNRAIQLLLSQEVGNGTEATAITLLVCYLLTCFDHLAGNYTQAMKHISGGVALSRTVDEMIPSKSNTPIQICVEPSEARTLIRQAKGQIRRLGMQAVMFLVDWTSADLQEVFIHQLPSVDIAFRSLDQAADHLQILIARVMILQNTEQQMFPPADISLSPTLSRKDVVLGQLETWSFLFENMWHKVDSSEPDFEPYPFSSLLRLQHLVAWIFLCCCGQGREMDYDNFLPQFQHCLVLASEVVAAHERYSGSRYPTFTPEIGIVPVLYIIGVKCRHPVVRREALTILRRQPIQEAVWDSFLAARVVERIMEIEEGLSEAKNGDLPLRMEQISAWQRIEVVSWMHVISDRCEDRLDLSYTFCAKEAMHTESLIL